jgi:RNA-directed DNA polymerase
MMNELEKSDPSIVAAKPANKSGRSDAESAEPRGGAKGNTPEPHTHQTQSRASVYESEQGKGRRNGSPPYFITCRSTCCERRISSSSEMRLQEWMAPRGASMGKTWKPSSWICNGRVHRGAYRALTSRRKFIQKEDWRERPLGIAALQDKIVQRAVVEMLNAIYEQDFLGFSYGFRPGRGQHDALDALAVGITHTKVSWIVDVDVRSFFDSMSHEWLIRFVEDRIGDPRMIRLIRKWLKAGVTDDAEWTSSDIGSPQGMVVSPTLANIYLHYTFDLWADQWRRHHARGNVVLVRYADDSVTGFEYETDAKHFLADLRERLEKFELSLHPDKTCLIEFGRFAFDAYAGGGEALPR